MTEGSESPRNSGKGRRIRQVKTLAEAGHNYFFLPLKLEVSKAVDPVPQEVVAAYEENREVIESIYGREKPNDNFYHGTGNLQYSGNKYLEWVSQDLRHPLDTILEQGIQPHYDIFNGVEGGYHSSSLATTWNYAKVYADLHQTPENPLKWENGDKADWLTYIMVGTAVSRGKDFVKTKAVHPRMALESLRRAKQFVSAKAPENDLGRLQKWISYVRKSTPSDTTRDIFHSRSDIIGNFGAVFTIDRNGVNVAPKGPGVYEVRTLEPVSPDHFLSVAVPLEKVGEVKERVKYWGYKFPVLPTEAVDYHMSQFPFKELTKNRRVPASLKSP